MLFAIFLVLNFCYPSFFKKKFSLIMMMMMMITLYHLPPKLDYIYYYGCDYSMSKIKLVVLRENLYLGRHTCTCLHNCLQHKIIKLI